MDLATIKSAYEGLKSAKEIFTHYNELKNDTNSMEKVNEAVKQVSNAQDALFSIRDMLFELQEENKNLKTAIRENENWERKIANYELTKTPGRAIVYKSIEGLEHYICPSCAENKQVYPLQDQRVMSGAFVCPSCKASYGIGKMGNLR